MSGLRHALVRLHLWVGELLGLTHYRDCWGCRHCRELDEVNRSTVLCYLDYDTDGVCAISNCCEAVWCMHYEKADTERTA